MIIPFERRGEDSLVVVNAQLDRIQTFMAVDTSASHTVLDINILLSQGYELKDAVRSILVETANGEIEAMIFKIKRMSALGIEKKDIEIGVTIAIVNVKKKTKMMMKMKMKKSPTQQ